MSLWPPSKWLKDLNNAKTSYGNYAAFQAAREKRKAGTTVDSHGTIELISQVQSRMAGGELKYFIVTLQYGSKTCTEAWMLEYGSSVLSKFAWHQQLQSGDLALLNAWETTKEIYNEIRWNDEARRALVHN